MTESQEPTTDDPSKDPLRSVHTSNFPELLRQLGASLLVTTYQAGKLVVLREDGGVLNTHFRNLNKPMGLARDGGRLAVGCGIDIWEFHNVPAVCGKLDESATTPAPQRNMMLAFCLVAATVPATSKFTRWHS